MASKKQRRNKIKLRKKMLKEIVARKKAQQNKEDK